MKILENLWQVGGAEFTTVEDAAIIEFYVGSRCGHSL